MKRKLKYSKSMDRDIILCATANSAASRQASEILLGESVPFCKSWRRVPFFKRGALKGASTVCTISIHKDQYSKARRALINLDQRYYDQLFVNVI